MDRIEFSSRAEARRCIETLRRWEVVLQTRPQVRGQFFRGGGVCVVGAGALAAATGCDVEVDRNDARWYGDHVDRLEGVCGQAVLRAIADRAAAHLPCGCPVRSLDAGMLALAILNDEHQITFPQFVEAVRGVRAQLEEWYPQGTEASAIVPPQVEAGVAS